MSRVRFSPAARLDLDGILTHLNGQSSDRARTFLTSFKLSRDTYALSPLLGPSAEGYAPGLRCFTVWNYVCFYRPVANGIQIVRILHGARDIPRIFESESPD